MAIPKTKLQITVNSELKKINPKFKVFTELQFRTNTMAKELLYMFSTNYLQEVTTKIDKLLKEQTNYINEELLNQYKNEADELNMKKLKLMYKIVGVDFEIDIHQPNKYVPNAVRDYDATAEFFGLENKIIINKIQSKIYSDILNCLINYDGKENEQVNQQWDIDNLTPKEYKHKHIKIDILRNFADDLNRWIEFCKTIDKFKIYINELYPNWKSMPKKAKQEYIASLKQLYNASFMNSHINLKNYIYFLENFGLSQIKKAKISLLLDCDFPNIDTHEIAQEVYNNTNLILKGFPHNLSNRVFDINGRLIY